MKAIVTSTEVAQYLLCEVTTVEEHLRRGKLPGLKFGRNWIVPTEALMQCLNQMSIDEANKRRKPVRPPRILTEKPGKRQKRFPPILPKLPLAS